MIETTEGITRAAIPATESGALSITDLVLLNLALISNSDPPFCAAEYPTAPPALPAKTDIAKTAGMPIRRVDLTGVWSRKIGGVDEGEENEEGGADVVGVDHHGVIGGVGSGV